MYYENFEKLCKINNVKPGTISKATGISTATLTSWKQGKYTPKQDKLSLIADYFNVSVDYLMTGEENPISDDIVSEHIELISKWIKLSPEKQKAVMDIIDALNGEGE